jgi:hypothetical protein
MSERGYDMARTMQGVVLLDISPGAGEAFERSFLEKVGHPALVCHGPHEGTLCPLLEGKGCADFEAAHGIVFELDLDRAQHRAIVERYQQLGREGMPIRVVATPEQAARYGDLLAGVEVWTHDPTAADLDGFAAEVEAADR